MKRQYTRLGGPVYTVAALGSNRWLVQTEDGQTLHDAEVRHAPDGTLLVTQQGLTRAVHVTTSGDQVWISGHQGRARWSRYEQRRGGDQGATDSVSAPMTGKVVVVNAREGHPVTKGEVLVVVEAMKMEQPLCAPRDGLVQAVQCAPGDLVDGGVVLVRLAPEEDA